MKSLQARTLAVYRGNGYGSTLPIANSELAGAIAQALAYSSVGTLVSLVDQPPVEGFTADAGFSVSGTLADGGEITITRASGSFGTKPGGAKPLYYIPYETNQAVHPTLSRTQRTMQSESGSTIQATIKPPNAAGAIRNSTNKSGASPTDDTGVFFSTDQAYIFVKKYMGHSSPANLKTVRMWTNDRTRPDIYTALGDIGNSYCEDVAEPQTTAGSRWHAIDSSTFNSVLSNTWRTWEHWYERSSSGQSNGYWNSAVDRTLLYPSTSGWKTRDSSYPGQITQIFLDQYSGTRPSAFVYHQCLYIDDSFFRVMVSPESSLTDTTSASFVKREICIPTAWDTDEITCVLRKGEHASLSGLYLWVFTGRHTAVRIGQFD